VLPSPASPPRRKRLFNGARAAVEASVNSPLPPVLPASSHGKPVDTFPQAFELERALKQSVRGEVRFDRGSRALYATDASNYRQIPIGLVVPRDTNDVEAAVAACRKFGAPVLPRGAGTSLAGQCCNVAVVLDFTKYLNGIIEIDPAARLACVQPGVVLDTLRARAEKVGLTFGPDPSTHSRCSLGGMIGNNSCGTHSLLAGKTVDNVEELRVLLYDGTRLTVGATSESELAAAISQGGRRGEIYSRLRAIRDTYADQIRARFPDIPRRVSGYNLDQLLPENGFHVARALVGSEGTCVTVLEARLRLIHSPPYRRLVGLGYRDVFTAADAVPEILEFGPIGLEGFEGAVIDGLRKKGAPHLELMPQGRGFLLVEFGADAAAESESQARRLMDRLGAGSEPPDMRLYSAVEARHIWKIRESGVRSAATAPGSPREWEGWDDSAVAPGKVGAYLRDLRKLLDEYRYRTSFYGHFGHGCIHMRITFDLESANGIRRYGEFVDRAADLVVRYGGSLSGEHGDGQSRGALLPKMYGPELVRAFEEFKSVWDPDNRMNPHKLVNAHLPTEDLRLGADYQPMQPKTHFQFPDDEGSFATAALRCIGLGECRQQEAGSMCPTYLATREEKHSTRGRAHMLFELLQGEIVRGGWQNEDVKESLDLCLSCKACKTDCPTNVDIATYKAEFLAHYFEQRARPLQAYALGLVDRWARLGSLAPGVANILAAAPGVKGALGLAAQRPLPKLASGSFRRWARRQHVPAPAGVAGEVILWADTFNNYFRPQTSRAALGVLRAAGLRVTVPRQHLCCGRPLYDFGMLDRAKQYLRQVMRVLRGPIEAGTPIVVLEPSCAAVFRDELRGLFPRHALAERLRAQVFLLSEFLEQRAPEFRPPQLSRAVLLHGHCHHRAVMNWSDEESLLRRMGAQLQCPETGCCGMAGPFGFDKNKYAVSQAVGERLLLPAVRQAAPETLIVSDGFSCREQIVHATGRAALHLADAIHLAMREAAGPDDRRLL
jgi:FAD/FMN-containing dehydrogenase/Fe-S oxidoreductase